MALNKQHLKSDILLIMTEMRNREDNSDEEYAERLSTAIDNYIKNASIIYTSGLSAPNGPVIGIFNGNLE